MHRVEILPFGGRRIHALPPRGPATYAEVTAAGLTGAHDVDVLVDRSFQRGERSPTEPSPVAAEVARRFCRRLKRAIAIGFPRDIEGDYALCDVARELGASLEDDEEQRVGDAINSAMHAQPISMDLTVVNFPDRSIYVKAEWWRGGQEARSQ